MVGGLTESQNHEAFNKSSKYFLQLEYSQTLLGDRFEYYSTKVVMIQSWLLEEVLSQSPFFLW